MKIDCFRRDLRSAGSVLTIFLAASAGFLMVGKSAHSQTNVDNTQIQGSSPKNNAGNEKQVTTICVNNHSGADVKVSASVELYSQENYLSLDYEYIVPKAPSPGDVSGICRDYVIENVPTIIEGISRPGYSTRERYSDPGLTSGQFSFVMELNGYSCKMDRKWQNHGGHISQAGYLFEIMATPAPGNPNLPTGYLWWFKFETDTYEVKLTQCSMSPAN